MHSNCLTHLVRFFLKDQGGPFDDRQWVTMGALLFNACFHTTYFPPKANVNKFGGEIVNDALNVHATYRKHVQHIVSH